MRFVLSSVLVAASLLATTVGTIPGRAEAAPAYWAMWLEHGWNLWSCPFENSTFTSAEDVQYPFTAKGFTDAFLGIKAISRLDADKTWQSYVRGYSEAYDFSLSTDEGYYVWMGNREPYNYVLMTCGPMDTDPTPLRAGWNLVSEKRQGGDTATENMENLLIHTEGGRATGSLDSGSATWYGYLTGWVYEHPAYVNSMGWSFYLLLFQAIYVWAEYPTQIDWTNWEPVPGLVVS